MICVECNEPVESLYVKYTNDYIKLTDCPSCSKVADKYVEFDNVILFIDTLLLKPQAYRHLVYNLMAENVVGGNVVKETSIKSWFERNKKINRIRLLMILFEIYLTWAYEEKNYNLGKALNPFLVMNAILEKSAVTQYLYFSLKCISDDVITHTLIPFFMFNFGGWNPKDYVSHNADTKRYYRMALSLTVLISGATKLFPILMLIWPYNNIAITNIISSVADLNLIEALRIVTNCSIPCAIAVFLCNTIVKFFTTRGLLIFILSKGDQDTAYTYMNNEYLNLLHRYWGIKKIIEVYLNALL